MATEYACIPTNLHNKFILIDSAHQAANHGSDTKRKYFFSSSFPPQLYELIAHKLWKFVDEYTIIHCTFILSRINFCLNQRERGRLCLLEGLNPIYVG